MEQLPASELRKDAAEDLAFTVQLCDKNYFVSDVHQFIARKLESVASGKVRRLIINCPPQHGKSRLCSVEFPAWLLGKDPTKRVVTASYSQDLAQRNSREARARMLSAEYQYLFQTRLDPTNQSVESWGVEGGGGYRAVGVGGSLTGHTADIEVIDDPLKDHAEANSASQREKVWDWFVSVAYTRLSPQGAIIVIMTRWHVDDLVGRLLDPDRLAQLSVQGIDSEKWEHINLPAIAEKYDLLGREEGAALYPERYSVDRLKATRAFLGSYMWSALYDQKPVRRGGNYINSGWFTIIRRELVPADLCWNRFWDLAATEDSRADFTAGVAGAIGDKGQLYLKDMICGQWEWPDSRGRMKAVAEAERIIVGVEAVGGFKTSVQNFREVVPNTVVREIGVDKDKLTRALPWIALAEAGKVFLVEGGWNVPFMAQAEAFPSGTNDDMVDAVSGVYGMLRSGTRVLVA